MTGNREGSLGETPEQAIVKLRRLIRLAPNDADLQFRLARRLVDCRRADEAVQLLRGIIAESPNHLDARKLLELALHRQAQRSHL